MADIKNTIFTRFHFPLWVIALASLKVQMTRRSKWTANVLHFPRLSGHQICMNLKWNKISSKCQLILKEYFQFILFLACSQNGDMQEWRKTQLRLLNHKGDNQNRDNANLCHKGDKPLSKRRQLISPNILFIKYHKKCSPMVFNPVKYIKLVYFVVLA